MKILLILLLVSLVSCSLFDRMRKNAFIYDNKEVLPLLVPKGFQKINVQTDTAGNKAQIFYYRNGVELFFYFGDTTRHYLPVDTSMNIPKYYPMQVMFYKGQDSSGLFWRESRYKNFRFGYKNVSAEREALFDSAVNHAGWQTLK